MNTVFRVLGSLCFLIWSVIGIVLLVGVITGLLFFQNGGPERMMRSVIPGIAGSSGQAKISSELKTCISQTLGEKRTEELLNGGGEPSATEMQQVSKACGSLTK